MISLLGAGEDGQNSTNSGNFTSLDLLTVKTNFNYLSIEGEKPPKCKRLKKHLKERSLSTSPGWRSFSPIPLLPPPCSHLPLLHSVPLNTSGKARARAEAWGCARHGFFLPLLASFSFTAHSFFLVSLFLSAEHDCSPLKASPHCPRGGHPHCGPTTVPSLAGSTSFPKYVSSCDPSRDPSISPHLFP